MVRGPVHARDVHTRPRSTTYALVALGALSLGCQSRDRGPTVRDTGGEPGREGIASPDPVVHIPVGSVTIGSPPGSPGRNPSLDPLPTPLELGPFRIDRVPLRDGQGATITVSSQKAAEALCAGHSGRLCTEIEWERACRGDLTVEPGALSEWTASSFGTGSELEGQPVVRKRAEPTNASDACAPRRSAKKDEPVAVRCCYGAPNAPRVQEPREEKTIFKIHPLTQDELVRLLEAHAETRSLAQGASLFPDDAAAAVLARGPGETKGFELTTAPLEWSPARGVRLLVVAGKSDGDTAFVVAFHMAPHHFAFASSFIMKKEKGPVALAYAPSIRPRVHFSTCWGCPGETGKALFREPESVVMLQP